MKSLGKTFECKTHLTLNQCKSRIEEKYSVKRLIGSTDIVIDSLDLDGDLLFFKLLQSKIRGQFVVMEARIIPIESGSHIEGSVKVNTLNFLTTFYFVIAGVVFAIVFHPIPLLSILFLLCCLMAVGFLIDTFRNRDVFVQTVCKSLKG